MVGITFVNGQLHHHVRGTREGGAVQELEGVTGDDDVEVSSVGQALKANQQRFRSFHLLYWPSENQAHPRMGLPEPLDDGQTLEETFQRAEILPATGRALPAESISCCVIAGPAGRVSGDHEAQATQLPTPHTSHDSLL
jgi:hypothetical protein